jgi:hypothetical protein
MVVEMWNAAPMAVPCVAASKVVIAGVMPAGQSVFRPSGEKPKRLRNRMAI